MDISSLSNSYLSQQVTQLNRQTEKVKSFQDVLADAAASNDDKKLLSACQEFEGYFIQMMFKEMRKTIDTSSSYIPKSNAEEIFQGMLDEEVAVRSAKGGRGMGLAQLMFEQMKRNVPANVDLSGE